MKKEDDGGDGGDGGEVNGLEDIENADIGALMVADGWKHTGLRTYVRVEKGATRMATPPTTRMRSRVTRDVDSGRLLEDLWIGDRTPEQLLRRELRMPANLETRIELLAVDEPAKGDFDDRPMEPQDASLYRAAVARTHFLAQDRCDLQFASKECSRWMSSPRIGDWALIKRIARYLIGQPRVAILFCWQDEPPGLSVFSDSKPVGVERLLRLELGGLP